MNIFFQIRTFVVTFVWVFGCSMLHAETASELAAKGDVADRSFEPALALKSYLQAENLAPNDVPLLLSIARQYRHLMSDVGNKNDKLKYGKLSLSYAKRAATLAPDSSDAQLSPAISYGKMMPYEGKGEQAAASPLIKAAADRAIKLDPTNDTAWHVLGRWHQSLANITGARRAIGEMLYGKLQVGTNAEAAKCFNKAMALNPSRLRHYIELGRTYAQMENDGDAKKYIQMGLKMPNREKDDYELKERGRETLAQLGK